MWYIMCGDNMLKIDVKKTLENGEENGMIKRKCNHRKSFNQACLFFLFAFLFKLKLFSFIQLTVFFLKILN